MFSALKRWTRMGGEESKLSMPSGVKAMGQALQRKFARGVQYNMKIIIKGDRNTGKTCMFHRLQGKPFNEQYIPTNEIQAGSIHWTYKAADDIVKVDVWDVVDVGKSRKPSDTLKIENNPSTENEGDDEAVADANFLDVYKGTHGVIMLMDITKPWTFQYIRRELPKVPAHIPVLVLGSHRDMEEHRLIDQEEVTSFIQNLERPDRSPPIHYAESSMKDGFGLKYIHTFLNFPFLLLQREALLQQLQVNAMDMESTLEELQLYKQTEEQDYYKYLDFLEEKQKERDRKLKAEAEARAVAENEAKASNENMSTSSSASPPQTNKASSKDSQPGGLRKWFSSSKPHIPNDEVIAKQQPASNAEPAPSNIEEFKPEDELDAGFLDEDSSVKEKEKVKNKLKKKSVEVEETPSESSDESDSDSGPVNPMVASFAEDISDDETVTNGNIQSEDTSQKPDAKPRPTVADVHITSSEEEEEEEEEKKETTEVLKPEVLKPTPLTTPKSKSKTQENSLKLKVRDSSSKTSIERREKKQDTNDIDDWLDSPDIDPKISFGTPKEDFTVTKVDINNPSEPAPPAPSITMDEWSLFMSEQMKMNEKKSKKPSFNEDEEPESESKHHKKNEHKSGEKSRSKKLKKHREKDEENEGEKEHRRSKHKDTDKEKRKSEDSEKKKKSRHKHSKKKSFETSEYREGVTYEEL